MGRRIQITVNTDYTDTIIASARTEVIRLRAKIADLRENNRNRILQDKLAFQANMLDAALDHLETAIDNGLKQREAERRMGLGAA